MFVPAGDEGGLSVGEVRRATRQELMQAALDAGVITRQWWCYAEASDCTPDDRERRGYLHSMCRWYWSMWTVDQAAIEAAFAMTPEMGVEVTGE